jgi:hypothetical protein
MTLSVPHGSTIVEPKIGERCHLGRKETAYERLVYLDLIVMHPHRQRMNNEPAPSLSASPKTKRTVATRARLRTST